MSVERVIQQVVRTLLDLGCIGFGLYGVWYQTVKVPPGQASEALLFAYVSLLGIPAGVGLISLRSNAPTGTTSSESQPVQQGSGSPPSSSPSAMPGGGERQ